MAMKLDIDQLQEELHDIDRQRHEVTERIRDYGVRGRGRGGFGVPGRPFHPAGAPMDGPGNPSSARHEPIPSFNEKFGDGRGFGVQRRPHVDADLGRPGRAPFYASENDRFGRQGTYSAPPPRAASYHPLDRDHSGPQNGRRDFSSRGPAQEPPAAAEALPGPPPLPAAPPKKKVLSAAVVVGSSLAEDAELPEAPEESPAPKRPRDDSEENPAMKKRNKRMFGALLGTLQRFKDEDAAAKRSRIAQQREEALKRADTHAAEELIRAREHERQQAAKARMAELNRKRELNAAAELKRAEIILARRYTHQAMLAKFLRTAAQPQLLWAPAKHCADTILLEEQRQLELAVWMDKEKGRLDENRTKVIERTKAIIEQAGKMRNAPVGRPGQKPDGGASRAGKEGDAEMQDAEAEAEADEEEQQEHGDTEADGEAEDAAAHAGGQMERKTSNPGKVDAADRYEAGPDEDMQKEEAEDTLEGQAAVARDGTAASAAETEVV